MSKAILILDNVKSCSECPLFENHYNDMCCRGLNNRTIDYPYPDTFRQKWCPLKPMPEKSLTGLSDYYQWGTWEDGYNQCIEEISGEEDDK